MAIPNITINKQSGLGRPLAGEDYKSGLLSYGTAPTGWSADGVERFFSVEDATAKGLDGLSGDATAGTSDIQITGAGATGDVVTISVNELNSVITVIGSYTVQAADTADLISTGLTASINSETYLTGYSATSLTDTTTVTAPLNRGVGANSFTNTIAITGTVTAVTSVAWVGGLGSFWDVLTYHIAEYFRLQPKGDLSVGIFTAGSYDFAEVETMQTIAEGSLRQIAVYAPLRTLITNGTADITNLQGQYNTLEALKRPVQLVYASDMSAVTDLLTLPNLATNNSHAVSAVIGQDGGQSGEFLYGAYGKSITTLGAVLGCIALSPVNETIAYRGKYNMSNGSNEIDTIAFANGTKYRGVSSSTISQLHSRTYVFQVKQQSLSGTYNVDSLTATAPTEDLKDIESNRVLDKTLRSVDARFAPLIGVSVQLNADGTLTEGAIQTFLSTGKQVKDQMVRDGEISDMEILIDPVQDVLTTNEIVTTVKVLPKGNAKYLTVNIGYVTSLN